MKCPTPFDPIGSFRIVFEKRCSLWVKSRKSFKKMAENYQDESAEFSVEDVEGIVRTAIHNSLNENAYNSKKVNEWTNNIVTNCLKDLQGLARPFKYIITCIIMQKTGAGLNTSTSMHWDASKDGYCKVPWQNSTMHCIVTVYGLSVNIEDPQDIDM